MLTVLDHFKVEIVLYLAIFFAVAISFLLHNLIRKKIIIWATVGIILLSISFSTLHYGTKLVSEVLEDQLVSFATSYAVTLQDLGHEALNAKSDPEDSSYLKMIDLEKSWVSSNHLISDVYTMKKTEAGDNFFVADSETDYDRDGVYFGDRESRTKIGEIYEKKISEIEDAFQGRPSFTRSAYQDKWGDWVSAFVPLYNMDGKQDGVLGVDFKAEIYLSQQRQIVIWNSFLTLLIEILVYSLHVRFLMDREYRLQIEKSLELAKEAKEVKSRFIANISHEIRTPLNGIVGMVNLFHQKTATLESVDEMMRILKSCSNQLLELVNDVLDFSKMEAGKFQIESVRFEFNKILEEALDAIRLRAEEKNLFLRIENLAPEMNWVMGDSTKLRQILVNLLGNAIKFTQAGGVTVTLFVEPSDGESYLMGVAVKDTGVGISQNLKNRLFQAFEQADASTTRQFGGTGLGLAISYHFAKAMGGNITVVSEGGKGSTFTLTLPLKKATPEILVNDKKELGEFKNELALVADDNQTNRLVLSRYLKKIGIESHEASNGQEAVIAVDKVKYDFVFMDCNMPVMDGYEATRKICESKFGNEIYVVAVTANSSEEERQRCLAAGMKSFLAKPYSIADLEMVLKQGRSVRLQKRAS